MNIIKNPARSRPLSANVRRLMKMARESPQNPDVEKVQRPFSVRDLAYCDMQGNIFMAALDEGLTMEEFAPLYMNSQLAGVIDYSFSCAGGMEQDDLSGFLKIPMLLKSPQVIVDVVVWLDQIVKTLEPGESANMAVVNACLSEGQFEETKEEEIQPEEEKQADLEEMTAEYEYAYWLGYIYRCECHLHDESSRMVYGAFDEAFMREFYQENPVTNEKEMLDTAVEQCHMLDDLLIGKLWQ